MIARISTIMNTKPEIFWKLITKPQSLQYVAKPILFFVPTARDDLNGNWEINKEYRVKLYLFKYLPFGSHTITIKKIDTTSNEIISNESGKLARVWNHTIRFQSINSNQIEYSDTIAIESGVLTVITWLFSHIFYRHRQRRWKTLLAKNSLSGEI